MFKKSKSLNMVLSALFLALAYIFPFFTGQIPEIGSMLCPMHIPVLICGMVCGWQWGLGVGFVAPLLRSATLGMPPMFPKALCMAFELAVYGLISGFMRKILPQKKIYIYISMIIAMVVGRLVWGASMYFCVMLKGGTFGMSAFLAGAVTNAIPGIILQLVFVPVIVMVTEKYYENK